MVLDGGYNGDLAIVELGAEGGLVELCHGYEVLLAGTRGRGDLLVLEGQAVPVGDLLRTTGHGGGEHADHPGSRGRGHAQGVVHYGLVVVGVNGPALRGCLGLGGRGSLQVEPVAAHRGELELHVREYVLGLGGCQGV